MSQLTAPSLKDREIAGERRLRQLLFVVDLLVFLVIAAVAVYIWRSWPRGHDVYSDLQRGASETYLLIWMGVALAARLRPRKRAPSLSMPRSTSHGRPATLPMRVIFLPRVRRNSRKRSPP
jgi:hypothetical protein